MAMPKAQCVDDGAEDAETTITLSLTGSKKLPYCIFWQSSQMPSANQCRHNISHMALTQVIVFLQVLSWESLHDHGVRC